MLCCKIWHRARFSSVFFASSARCLLSRLSSSIDINWVLIQLFLGGLYCHVEYQIANGFFLLLRARFSFSYMFYILFMGKLDLEFIKVCKAKNRWFILCLRLWSRARASTGPPSLLAVVCDLIKASFVQKKEQNSALHGWENMCRYELGNIDHKLWLGLVENDEIKWTSTSTSKYLYLNYSNFLSKL